MNHEFEILETSSQFSDNTHKIFQNLETETINALIIRHQQGQRDFRGIDLNGLDLSGINMSHADLRGANFFNCELRCANLDCADLREANFKDANLKAASLNNCDLRGANLTDTQLGLAILNGANLSSSVWERVNCHRTSLTGATLPDGSQWLFKTFASGKELSEEELLTQNQQAFSRRKGLASLGMLVTLVGGFELMRLIVPFVFWFWK